NLADRGDPDPAHAPGGRGRSRPAEARQEDDRGGRTSEPSDYALHPVRPQVDELPYLRESGRRDVQERHGSWLTPGCAWGGQVVVGLSAEPVIRRRKPASQVRTPATKSSIAVLSPRLRCKTNPANSCESHCWRDLNLCT